MRYQDELEAGKRSRKPEMSIAEQVEHYRKKQLRKVSLAPNLFEKLMQHIMLSKYGLKKCTFTLLYVHACVASAVVCLHFVINGNELKQAPSCQLMVEVLMKVKVIST
jgi:cwf21 domain